ncbi:hypothetical protein [Persicobacter psychrovividus]|uniref:Uncharacterized protein n=1 Tax=Persicobacter psychrovividus TaxID=387638 RepID=A0ABN6L5R7_9BACT|nr:hypothetical protein PEPS_05910 [Persicobacter psychrovividus]
MEFFERNIRSCRWGLLLAVFTIFCGFALGGVFGANEAALKGQLKSDGQAVLSSVYKGDQKKMDKTISKSWSYLKRAHLHAGAIGAAVVGLLLLLAFLPTNAVFKLIISWMLGLGTLGYSLFWLLAGFSAPAIGGTHEAKEALEWLAIPSAGMLLIGTLAVFLLLLSACFTRKRYY